MELYQLTYFLEVARQRNFTRAAERLRIAQPALSQQMKNLETELGAALFVRGRRQTVLTAAGRSLLPRAESLLTQAGAAKEAVAAVAGLRGGQLVIATIPSISVRWLPRSIQRFRTRHPQVELRLIEHSSEGVAELVESHQADMGFLQLPVATASLRHRALLREPFLLLLPSAHPKARRAPVRLRDLADETFVFYKGRARDTVLTACRAAGFEPQVACESGELETVRALVAAGLGVAVLPQLAMPPLPSTLAAVPLARPGLHRTIGVAWNGGAGLPAAGGEFLKLVDDAQGAP